MFTGLDKENFLRKNVHIVLPISFSICFGCSKETSQWDGSFMYPQHMFWIRNKKIIFWYALISKGLMFSWLVWLGPSDAKWKNFGHSACFVIFWKISVSLFKKKFIQEYCQCVIKYRKCHQQTTLTGQELCICLINHKSIYQTTHFATSLLSFEANKVCYFSRNRLSWNTMPHLLILRKNDNLKV